MNSFQSFQILRYFRINLNIKNNWRICMSKNWRECSGSYFHLTWFEVYRIQVLLQCPGAPASWGLFLKAISCNMVYRYKVWYTKTISNWWYLKKNNKYILSWNNTIFLHSGTWHALVIQNIIFLKYYRNY